MRLIREFVDTPFKIISENGKKFLANLPKNVTIKQLVKEGKIKRIHCTKKYK